MEVAEVQEGSGTPVTQLEAPAQSVVQQSLKKPASPIGQLEQSSVKPSGPRCPACGATPLTDDEMQIVRKPGRRSKRDAQDPRNRPENLVTKEFLMQHIVTSGMSLRDIGSYHGYTISTLSRRAKQEGVPVGARARQFPIGMVFSMPVDTSAPSVVKAVDSSSAAATQAAASQQQPPKAAQLQELLPQPQQLSPAAAMSQEQQQDLQQKQGQNKPRAKASGKRQPRQQFERVQQQQAEQDAEAAVNLEIDSVDGLDDHVTGLSLKQRTAPKRQRRAAGGQHFDLPHSEEPAALQPPHPLLPATEEGADAFAPLSQVENESPAHQQNVVHQAAAQQQQRQSSPAQQQPQVQATAAVQAQNDFWEQYQQQLGMQQQRQQHLVVKHSPPQQRQKRSTQMSGQQPFSSVGISPPHARPQRQRRGKSGEQQKQLVEWVRRDEEAELEEEERTAAGPGRRRRKQTHGRQEAAAAVDLQTAPGLELLTLAATLEANRTQEQDLEEEQQELPPRQPPLQLQHELEQWLQQLRDIDRAQSLGLEQEGQQQIEHQQQSSSPGVAPAAADSVIPAAQQAMERNGAGTVEPQTQSHASDKEEPVNMSPNQHAEAGAHIVADCEQRPHLPLAPGQQEQRESSPLLAVQPLQQQQQEKLKVAKLEPSMEAQHLVLKPPGKQQPHRQVGHARKRQQQQEEQEDPEGPAALQGLAHDLHVSHTTTPHPWQQLEQQKHPLDWQRRQLERSWLRSQLLQGPSAAEDQQQGSSPVRHSVYEDIMRRKLNRRKIKQLDSAVQQPGRHACLSAVHACLAAGQDVNQPTTSGHTILHVAAEKNPDPAAVSSVIQLLVAEGANVRARTDDGSEPLHFAAKNVHAAAAAIEALVSAGADVSARTNRGQTPLHCAFQNKDATGAAAAVQALLAAGSDVRARTNSGLEPLHLAAWCKNEATAVTAIQALVAAGADVLARADDGTEPLHWATVHECAPGVIQALLAAGADARAHTAAGTTPLHWAASNKNAHAAVAAVQALLAAGADVKARAASGTEVLHCAAENGDPAAAAALVQALVAAGADVRAKNDKGEEPLHRAAARGRVESVAAAVEALVAAGADVRAKDNNGQEPLHHVAANNDEAAVAAIEMLVAAGADVRAKDNCGREPLQAAQAAAEGAAAAVHALVAAGADGRGKALLQRAAQQQEYRQFCRSTYDDYPMYSSEEEHIEDQPNIHAAAWEDAAGMDQATGYNYSDSHPLAQQRGVVADAGTGWDMVDMSESQLAQGEPKLQPGVSSAQLVKSAVAEQAAQLKLQKAVVAFQAADLGSSLAMMRPLNWLRLAGKGGSVLEDIIMNWDSYSPDTQRDLFSTALLVTKHGRWDRLEHDLQLELRA